MSTGGKKLVTALRVDQHIDEIALKTIRFDCPSDVVPISLIEINGQHVLEYNCSNFLDFEYLPKSLSCYEFISLIEGLTELLLDCESWFLDFTSFCFDTKFVFYERNSYQLKLLYLPISEYHADVNDISNLFSLIVRRFHVINGEKLQYELLKVIMEPKFSLMQIAEVIKDFKHDQQKSLVTAREHEIHIDSGSDANVPSRVEEIEVKENPTGTEVKEVIAEGENVLERLKNNCISEDLDTHQERKWFGFFKLNNNKQKQAKRQRFKSANKLTEAVTNTTVFSDSPVVQPESKQPNEPSFYAQQVVYSQKSEKTEMIETRQEHYYWLECLNNESGYQLPQRIMLEFNDMVFTVGRFDAKYGVKQSSYEFPAEVKCISRFHTRIEKQREKLMLIDLDSSNGTFINDYQLPPNIPKVIEAGDIIAFSTKVKYRLHVG